MMDRPIITISTITLYVLRVGLNSNGLAIATLTTLYLSNRMTANCELIRLSNLPTITDLRLTLRCEDLEVRVRTVA